MKYYKMTLMAIFIFIFFRGCTSHVLEYVNPHCKDSVIEIGEDMIMFDGRFYHNNLLNGITYNELMSYEEYKVDLEYSFNYRPDEFKELKLYKVGSKFQIIGHYYLNKSFLKGIDSGDSDDYLVKSLDDNSIAWLDRFNFNENKCIYEKDAHDFYENIDSDKFMIPVVFFEPIITKFKEKGMDLRVVTKSYPKNKTRYLKDVNRSLPRLPK